MNRGGNPGARRGAPRGRGRGRGRGGNRPVLIPGNPPQNPPQNPPNNPPGANAPVPPAPVRPRSSVIRAAEAAFRVTIARSSEAKVSKLGLPYRVVEDTVSGMNPHAELAFFRTASIVWSLSRLLQNDNVTAIDFIYGNNRDLNILAWFNNQLANNGYPPVLGNLMGDHIMGNDPNRRPDVPIQQLGQAALLVDVYEAGGTYSNPNHLTHEWVAQLGYTHVIALLHPFRGSFGSVGSAMWIRTKENKILWYADATANPYPPHDPCDILHANAVSNGYGRAVAHNWSIGSTPVIHAVEWLPTNAPDKPPSENARHLTSTYTIPDPISFLTRRLPSYMSSLLIHHAFDFIMQFARWFPSREVTLQHSHVAALRSFIQARSRNTYSLKSLMREAASLLARDNAFQLAINTFPEQFATYQMDLALVVFSVDSAVTASSLHGVRSAYAQFFASSNATMADIANPTSETAVWSSVIAVGLFLTWKFLPDKKKKTVDAGTAKGLDSLLRAGEKWFNHCLYVLNENEPVVLYSKWPHLFCFLFGFGAGIGVTLTTWLNVIAEEAFKRIPYMRVPASVLLWIGDITTAVLSMKAMNGHFPISWAALIMLKTVFVNPVLHQFFANQPFISGVLTHLTHNFLQVWFNCTYLALTNGMVFPSGSLPAIANSKLWGLPIIASFCWLAYKWFTRKVEPVLPVVELFDAMHYSHERVAHEWQPTGAIVPCTDEQLAVISVEPNSAEPHPELSPSCRVINDYNPLVDDAPSVVGYWCMFRHNAPMYRPAGGTNSMEVVAYHRLAKRVLVDDLDPTDLLLRWQATASYFVNAEPTGDEESFVVNARIDGVRASRVSDIMELQLPRLWSQNEISLEHDAIVQQDTKIAWWLRHVDPAKKARYLAALTQNDGDEIGVTHKELNSVDTTVKRDEVLLKEFFKPRPIHSVHPRIAVTVGPDVYLATKKLQTLWDSYCPGESCGLALYLTFGAGLTAAQLDQWFDTASNVVGIHVIVAGDDMAWLANFRDHTYQQGELDVSSCDHSTRRQALNCEMSMHAALSVPLPIIQLLMKNQSSACVIAPRKAGAGTIKIVRSPERNTGGTNTTFGNTANVAAALCASFMELNSPHKLPLATLEEGLIKGMAAHGFEVKTRSSEGVSFGVDIWPHSFLKGTWWLGADHKWHWGPLLSRLLKLSKIMTDPRFVYHKQLWKADNLLGPDGRTLRLALQCHAAAIAIAMRPFAVPKPVRDFLERLGQNPPATPPTADVMEEFEEHKPRGSGGHILADCWVQQAASWYAVEPDVIADWARSLALTNLGDFNDHELWPIMAKHDYG